MDCWSMLLMTAGSCDSILALSRPELSGEVVFPSLGPLTGPKNEKQTLDNFLIASYICWALIECFYICFLSVSPRRVWKADEIIPILVDKELS